MMINTANDPMRHTSHDEQQGMDCKTDLVADQKTSRYFQLKALSKNNTIWTVTTLITFNEKDPK